MLAVSHSHTGGAGEPQSGSWVQDCPDELCVLDAALQMMQSPGSIFGFDGMKICCSPLPSWTVGVRGVARLRHTAGVVPDAQFGVMQSVCADAGAPTTKSVTATPRRPGMDQRERSMALLLRDRRNLT
jgi:hypothetical protein